MDDRTKVKTICIRLPISTIAALDKAKERDPLASRSTLINKAVKAHLRK